MYFGVSPCVFNVFHAKINVFPCVYADLTLCFFSVFGNGDFTIFLSVSSILGGLASEKKSERTSERASESERERERESRKESERVRKRGRERERGGCQQLCYPRRYPQRK